MTIARIQRVTGLALVAALAVALVGCATPPKYANRVEAEPGADFTQFKTFAFPEKPQGDPRSLKYSPNVVSRLNAVFARQLEAEGLRRVFVEADADLVVSYGISSRAGQDVRIVPMAWSRAHDPAVRLQSQDEFGMHDSSYDVTKVDRYHDGMLVLELWDNKAGRVAWRAWISGEIKEDRNENFAALDEALRDAFEQFPPQAPTK
jgi:hypothetical protein